VERCPSCRSDFLKTRNRALESVISQLTVARKDVTCGCNMKIAMANITAHKENSHLCPISNCASKSPLAGMRDHVITHGTDLSIETRRSSLHIPLGCMGEGFLWQRIMLFSDEVFIHTCHVTNGSLYAYVLHDGDKEKTAKFIYSLSITLRAKYQYVRATDMYESSN
jgi:hypothetical protein